MIVHLTIKFPAHEIYIFPVISCVCWLIQLRYSSASEDRLTDSHSSISLFLSVSACFILETASLPNNKCMGGSERSAREE